MACTKQGTAGHSVQAAAAPHVGAWRRLHPRNVLWQENTECSAVSDEGGRGEVGRSAGRVCSEQQVLTLAQRGRHLVGGHSNTTPTATTPTATTPTATAIKCIIATGINVQPHLTHSPTCPLFPQPHLLVGEGPRVWLLRSPTEKVNQGLAVLPAGRQAGRQGADRWQEACGSAQLSVAGWGRAGQGTLVLRQLSARIVGQGRAP